MFPGYVADLAGLSPLWERPSICSDHFPCFDLNPYLSSQFWLSNKIGIVPRIDFCRKPSMILLIGTHVEIYFVCWKLLGQSKKDCLELRLLVTIAEEVSI